MGYVHLCEVAITYKDLERAGNRYTIETSVSYDTSAKSGTIGLAVKCESRNGSGNFYSHDVSDCKDGLSVESIAQMLEEDWTVISQAISVFQGNTEASGTLDRHIDRMLAE